ncbi:MAG: HAD family hydrolase [Verrucomicrobiota bacterium]
MNAVIFDMDGVLTDSEPVINEAAIRGLREYGIDPQPKDFDPFVGMGEDRYIGGVAETYGLRYTPDMKRRVYQIYLKILPDRPVGFPGVHKLLDTLNQAGRLIALASSADRIKVTANLEAIDIETDRFAALVTGEEVERKKPAPDIYLEASGQLGVAPDCCCVVEDAVSGVQAAKAAGMRCIAVTTSFAKDELLSAGADSVRPALADIRLSDFAGVAEPSDDALR